MVLSTVKESEALVGLGSSSFLCFVVIRVVLWGVCWIQVPREVCHVRSGRYLDCTPEDGHIGARNM